MVRIEPGTAVSPPTEEMLAKFEAYYRIRLPNDYRHFLQAGNGARVEECVFDAGGRERMIERFLCIVQDVGDHPAGAYDIGVVWTQIEDRLIDDEELEYGTNMVPIAALFGGDFVCLDYRGSGDEPTVVIWDHELSEELCPHTTPTSTTFRGFLQLLRRPRV